MQNNVIKYNNRIGQKTGILQNSKKVHTSEINVALVDESLHLKVYKQTKIK